MLLIEASDFQLHNVSAVMTVQGTVS